MTTALEQALVDLESQREERTFELYRNWSVEHATAIERRLREEEAVTAPLATPSPHVSRRSLGLGTLGGLLLWAVLLSPFWWPR